MLKVQDMQGQDDTRGLCFKYCVICQGAEVEPQSPGPSPQLIHDHRCADATVQPRAIQEETDTILVALEGILHLLRGLRQTDLHLKLMCWHHSIL